MTELADVLADVRYVLLDFDGPVCAVFSDRPNHVTATELRNLLESKGIALPEQFSSNRDPLKILTWVSKAHPHHTVVVDDVLTEQEVASTPTARPTAGAHALLRRLAARHISVAVVSNNSEQSIRRYLETHDLTNLVNVVVGRAHGRPDLMKPDPHSLNVAMKRLGAEPSECVFVGDTPTDVQAARAADVRVVGYAKSDRHRQALVNAGPDLLVDNMTTFVDTLEAA